MPAIPATMNAQAIKSGSRFCDSTASFRPNNVTPKINVPMEIEIHHATNGIPKIVRADGEVIIPVASGMNVLVPSSTLSPRQLPIKKGAKIVRFNGPL